MGYEYNTEPSLRSVISVAEDTVAQLANTAKGKYTEITSILAPASAEAGSRVDVTVKVKNIDSLFDHLVACVAIFDSTRFIDQAVIIKSLKTHSFTGSFTMPSKNVTIYAYSYYPVGADWILDDQKTKKVSLSELVPTFSEFSINFSKAKVI